MLANIFDPNFAWSTALDVADFSGIHYGASLFGAMLAVYVMQLWGASSLSIPGDCVLSFHLRRTALATLALAMLWSLSYASTKGWKPWPPDVFALIGIDMLLLSTVVIAFRRRRAMG